jgi:hypothetical protein
MSSETKTDNKSPDDSYVELLNMLLNDGFDLVESTNCYYVSNVLFENIVMVYTRSKSFRIVYCESSIVRASDAEYWPLGKFDAYTVQDAELRIKGGFANHKKIIRVS